MQRKPYPFLFSETNPRVLQSFVALTAALLVGGQAQAATFTWNNSGTDINTSTSWNSSTSGGIAAGGTAVFAAAATTQPNLSSALSINSLYFSTSAASGYDLTSASGNTVALTLTSTGASAASYAISSQNTSGANTIDAALILGATSGTQTFAQKASGTLVINGNISGGNSNAALDLSGNIKLTGNNTFTNNVELLGSTNVYTVSSLGNAGGSGNFGAGTTILINGGAGTTLKYTGAGETSNKIISLNNTAGGTIDTTAATGALVLTGDMLAPASGAKTLALKGGATNSEFQGKISDGTGGGTTALSISGVWILSGANTFSGGVTMSSGTLGIKNASALGTGTFSPGAASIDNLTGSALTLSTNNAITLNNTTGINFIGTNNLNMGTGTVTLSTSSTGPTITVSAGVLTFGGNFVESAASKGLTKAGAGTLVLNGNNSYTGLTTVSAGTLTLAGDNSAATGGVSLASATAVLNINHAKALGTGTLTMGYAGATIDNTSGNALTLTTNNALALTNSFTFAGSNDLNLGTGAVNLNGITITVNAHALTIGGNIGSTTNTLGKTGNGTLVLAGNNANTGKITISAGTLQFAKIVSLLNGSTSNYTTAKIQVESGATLAVNVGGSGEFTSTELDALKSVGSVSSGFKNGSILGLDTTGGNFTYGSNIANTNGGANALGLTKLGSNTLTLTGSNTYTGATTVSAGTLAVNGSLAAGSAVTVNAGASLGGSGTVAGTVNVLGGTINGNGLSMGATTLTGASTMSGNASASSLTVASGTTSVTGNVSTSGTLSVSVGATVKNGNAITANTVNVANGATLANNGLVTGTVNVTGLLSGTGTIQGALTIKSTGEFAPGNSAGITTVNGALVVESGAKVSMQIDGLAGAGVTGGYDQIVVGSTGSVSLASGSILNLTLGTVLALNSSLILIDNESTSAIIGKFTSVTIGNNTYDLSTSDLFTYGGLEYTLSYKATADGDGIGNDLALVVVPEPSTWAMVAGGIGMLAVGQRLRRRVS